MVFMIQRPHRSRSRTLHPNMILYFNIFSPLVTWALGSPASVCIPTYIYCELDRQTVISNRSPKKPCTRCPLGSMCTLEPSRRCSCTYKTKVSTSTILLRTFSIHAQTASPAQVDLPSRCPLTRCKSQGR